MITHYFPVHRGGIERVAEELARALLETGVVEVEWFASDCDEPPPAAPHFTAIAVPSWNVLEERTGLPYPIWSPTAWPKLWRSIRACNVVHVHDYIYMGSLLAWAMAKLSRRPVLITQHVGNIPFSSKTLEAVLKFTNASLGRMVLNGSAAVAFVSERVKRQFFPGGGQHADLIANGIDTSIYHPVAEDKRMRLRESLDLSPDRPLLLFVGRFVAKKGLPLLERIVGEMPEVQWVFAGRGPLDPSAWGMSGVKVFRDRSGPTLAELYQAADLLVLPSSGEGFPLVVQEALACGTPVLAGAELAGALPGIDRVLITEDVDSSDAAARWQHRLLTLLSNMDDLASRRQEAANFAAENWAWRNCAAEYLERYRTVARR